MKGGLLLEIPLVGGWRVAMIAWGPADEVQRHGWHDWKSCRIKAFTRSNLSGVSRYAIFKCRFIRLAGRVEVSISLARDAIAVLKSLRPFPKLK